MGSLPRKVFPADNLPVKARPVGTDFTGKLSAGGLFLGESDPIMGHRSGEQLHNITGRCPLLYHVVQLPRLLLPLLLQLSVKRRRHRNYTVARNVHSYEIAFRSSFPRYFVCVFHRFVWCSPWCFSSTGEWKLCGISYTYLTVFQHREREVCLTLRIGHITQRYCVTNDTNKKLII